MRAFLDPGGAASGICRIGIRRIQYYGRVAFERISVDPDKTAGVPCIRDLRFPVATVVAMVADGMSTEEILAEHPSLEAADVSEALRYAALAVQERELPLRLPA